MGYELQICSEDADESINAKSSVISKIIFAWTVTYSFILIGFVFMETLLTFDLTFLGISQFFLILQEAIFSLVFFFLRLGYNNAFFKNLYFKKN